MRSCAEQPFTVYACAGRGQIRSRNFSERRKAPLICAPVTLHQRLFASWYLFFCVCCACAEWLPHKRHVREWLQCSVHAGALPEKSAEKRQKTSRLPIAHYKHKKGRFRFMAGQPVHPYSRSSIRNSDTVKKYIYTFLFHILKEHTFLLFFFFYLNTGSL